MDEDTPPIEKQEISGELPPEKAEEIAEDISEELDQIGQMLNVRLEQLEANINELRDRLSELESGHTGKLSTGPEDSRQETAKTTDQTDQKPTSGHIWFRPVGDVFQR